MQAPTCVCAGSWHAECGAAAQRGKLSPACGSHGAWSLSETSITDNNKVFTTTDALCRSQGTQLCRWGEDGARNRSGVGRSGLNQYKLVGGKEARFSCFASIRGSKGCCAKQRPPGLQALRSGCSKSRRPLVVHGCGSSWWVKPTACGLIHQAAQHLHMSSGSLPKLRLALAPGLLAILAVCEGRVLKNRAAVQLLNGTPPSLAS